MRFNCVWLIKYEQRKLARTYKKYLKAKEWHDHFCWLPIRLEDGKIIWLETIQNRFVILEKWHDTPERQVHQFRYWRWFKSNNEWREKA